MTTAINSNVPPVAPGASAGRVKQIKVVVRGSARRAGQFHNVLHELAVRDLDSVSHVRAHKCPRMSVRLRLRLDLMAPTRAAQKQASSLYCP